MPIREEREYRSFALMQPVESEDGDYIVEGYATTVDVPYRIGFSDEYEVILASAFAGTDFSDVIFQLNHEGAVMARTRNATLRLDLASRGLHVTADLGGSQLGRDTYEAIRNGLMDRMSLGFTVPLDGYSFNPATRTATISKISKVFDVSVVSLPANDATDIHSRSIDGVIERVCKEFAEREKCKEERERIAAFISLV